MTTLTRRYRFCASHQLRAASYSEERNREVFGKCANAFGHGHNYYLEVSVQGDPDPLTGMVLPREALDRWVTGAVLDRIDHTHLNTEVPDFRRLVPTSENLILVVESWLLEGWREHFPDQPVRLAGVRLEETPRNSFRLPLPGSREPQ